MKKKIDLARDFLQHNSDAFRCPLCHGALEHEEYTLKCQLNHRFDLSKKGTLYFLKGHNQSDYDHDMFSHRQVMINSGMYQEMLQAIVPQMQGMERIIDVGCGEGSFLAQLSKMGVGGTKIGFDLSKEGVYLASSQPIEAFWCVADLTNLPFADQSADCLLNIFSPSHYNEFRRVLKPDGLVIKIVPESGYLQELRAALFPGDAAKQTYSNEKVVEKFSQSMEMIADQQINTVFHVPAEHQQHLLEMSPLEWQADPKMKKEIQRNPLENVTIHLRMLVGRNR